MIHNLQLQNFRGIESVSFDDLTFVNLIVGGNNTGKTSILEALALLYSNGEQLRKLPGFRQSPKNNDEWTNFWPRLVREECYDDFIVRSGHFSVYAKKDISSSSNSGVASFYRKTDEERQLEDSLRIFDEPSEEIRSKELPFVIIENSVNGKLNTYNSENKLNLAILPTTQPDPIETSRLFNEIAPLNPQNETKLEELLREAIEPRLRRLRYAKLKDTQEHLVYVDLGSGPMIPFTQMGQAFARTLHIYCEIFSNQPDILLIDEIENGLYYEGLEDFWKGLFAVLKDQKIQLFATTHSRECMEAASKASKADASIDTEPMLRFLRLDRHVDTDKIIGTSFGGDILAHAVEFGQEMR